MVLGTPACPTYLLFSGPLPPSGTLATQRVVGTASTTPGCRVSALWGENTPKPLPQRASLPFCTPAPCPAALAWNLKPNALLPLPLLAWALLGPRLPLFSGQEVGPSADPVLVRGGSFPAGQGGHACWHRCVCACAFLRGPASSAQSEKGAGWQLHPAVWFLQPVPPWATPSPTLTLTHLLSPVLGPGCSYHTWLGPAAAPHWTEV